MPVFQQRSGIVNRRTRAIKILVPVLLAWGCGNSPTAPSSDVPVAFVIIAGMNLIGVCEVMPFTATAYPGAGPTNGAPGFHGVPFDVTRQALWASSDSTTVTISSDGLATARGPGTAEISASYKGSSYSLMLDVVRKASNESLSGYVGRWSGVVEMTCQPLRGEGRSICDPLLSGVPASVTRPIELTLSPVGDMLSGTLSLNQSPMTLTVRAALDRGLVIGGTLRSGEGAVIVQLRDTLLYLTTEGRLASFITADDASVNTFGSQLDREHLSAIRGLTRDE